MRRDLGIGDVLFCAFMAFAFGGLIGVMIGESKGRQDMRREAIEHNAAHWDAKTAEFKWNDEPSERDNGK